MGNATTVPGLDGLRHRQKAHWKEAMIDHEMTCIRCGRSLKRSGALIFSYPGDLDTVFKYDVCLDCWHDSLLAWMDGDATEALESAGTDESQA